MKVVIVVDIAEGREDEVPKTLPNRATEILALAFAELVDEGVIDITSDIEQG